MMYHFSCVRISTEDVVSSVGHGTANRICELFGVFIVVSSKSRNLMVTDASNILMSKLVKKCEKKERCEFVVMVHITAYVGL